ncbi:MT-A70-domain-containing protein [Leucosporidium creatinivorum]|uniref:MT-A70-domain-containing protein n=1 Tax=Leucosporidium creatinivorum TaxID=106004 RepID=A0A1Y2EZH1_9BASI|nr:MT-A70-domain-containing protein [Leucosporidium creatinivorum]
MDNVPLNPFQPPPSAPAAPRFHSNATSAAQQQQQTPLPAAPQQPFRPQYAARPPARQGAPASSRNFALSSAGGAAAGAGRGRGGGAGSPPRFEGAGRGVTLSQAQENKKAAWGESYNVAEETIRNDYSSHYVRTGERPQNHLRGADIEARFDEYPKLASLLTQKHALTSSPTHSIPPTYLTTGSTSLTQVLPSLYSHRFDVILLSPPADTPFEELRALELSRVAATPGFVWLWVGSGVRGDGIGLERGRELLAAWGYRRSEDIVWLKTNKSAPENDLVPESDTLFTPTIEHCLMGIRGTVRRSNDPWFVHCNVDTDVLVWEGDSTDPSLKPPELQSLVENFCLGTRRLHLYGSAHSLRRGWLTVGADFRPLDPSAPSTEPHVRSVEGEKTSWTPQPYERESFERLWSTGRPALSIGMGGMDGEVGGMNVEPIASLLPFVEELDALRPKSPPPRNGMPSSGGLGRGRGAGLGITRSGVANAVSPSPGPNGVGRGRGRGGYPSQPTFSAPQQHQPSPYYPSHPQQQPHSFGYTGNPAFDYQQHQFFAMQQQALQLQMQQQAVFAQWVAMGGPNMNGMAMNGMAMNGMGGQMMGMPFGAGGGGGGAPSNFGGGAPMGGAGAVSFQSAYPVGGPGLYGPADGGGGGGQMDDADEYYGAAAGGQGGGPTNGRYHGQ